MKDTTHNDNTWRFVAILTGIALAFIIKVIAGIVEAVIY